jgi:hypothetical protein
LSGIIQNRDRIEDRASCFRSHEVMGTRPAPAGRRKAMPPLKLTISCGELSPPDPVVPTASWARRADVEDAETILRPRRLTAEIVAAIGQVLLSDAVDEENITTAPAAL